MKCFYVFALAFLVSVSQVSAEESGKHLFILSGQSNIKRLNPDLSFTPVVAAAFGKDNVIIVKDAQGNMPIRHWHKQWKPVRGDEPKATGDLYDRLMNKVAAAVNGKKILTVTFIWMQGETDAREAHGEVYAASLQGLLDQISNDLGRNDINVVIGRINDFGIKHKNFPHWLMVRNAQEAFAKAASGRVLVDTDDLNDIHDEKGKKMKDDIHCSIEGYTILGERFAKAAIYLINNGNNMDWH